MTSLIILLWACGWVAVTAGYATAYKCKPNTYELMMTAYWPIYIPYRVIVLWKASK